MLSARGFDTTVRDLDVVVSPGALEEVRRVLGPWLKELEESPIQSRGPMWRAPNGDVGGQWIVVLDVAGVSVDVLGGGVMLHGPEGGEPTPLVFPSDCTRRVGEVDVALAAPAPWWLFYKARGSVKADWLAPLVPPADFARLAEILGGLPE